MAAGLGELTEDTFLRRDRLYLFGYLSVTLAKEPQIRPARHGRDELYAWNNEPEVHDPLNEIDTEVGDIPFHDPPSEDDKTKV